MRCVKYTLTTTLSCYPIWIFCVYFVHLFLWLFDIITDYVSQSESPGCRNRSASCSWPLPEICLNHELDDVDVDGDDDGESDGSDEGEVDNCLKDSDEKPDGGDPPCPHPQSSHLTHPCFYANCGNMCDVVLSFKCSNILLF